MKLVVGLGNPGKKYEFTRHNLGFYFIDYLIAQWQKDSNFFTLENKKEKLFEEFDYEYAGDGVVYQDITLLKPLTYMNKSGEAVIQYCKYNNFEPKDFANQLIVVHDDLDLSFGRIKLDQNASAAGHNGVQNIIDHLKTKGFTRLRIGIKPTIKTNDMADYVLKKFAKNEKEELITSVFPRAQTGLDLVIQGSFEKAQNFLNKKN